MNFELMASMMCANYGNLEKEVKILKMVALTRSISTSKPLDVHRMIEHPNNNIEIFLDNLRKGDTVYIHPEAEYHPSTTLQKIINAGMTTTAAMPLLL